MGGIPEDIKKGILGLAKSSGKDAKELVGELKEIIAEDSTIQSMEKTEFKVRYGYAILLIDIHLHLLAQQKCILNHFQNQEQEVLKSKEYQNMLVVYMQWLN